MGGGDSGSGLAQSPKRRDQPQKSLPLSLMTESLPILQAPTNNRERERERERESDRYIYIYIHKYTDNI